MRYTSDEACVGSPTRQRPLLPRHDTNNFASHVEHQLGPLSRLIKRQVWRLCGPIGSSQATPQKLPCFRRADRYLCVIEGYLYSFAPVSAPASAAG